MWRLHKFVCLFVGLFVCLFETVKFLLKTDGGFPKDAEVTLFTLANPGSSLRFNTHWSAPPVSALARLWVEFLLKTDSGYLFVGMKPKFFFWFWIHTAGETSTAETHTDEGAVMRKPGSVWLEDTPAISVIIYLFFEVFWLLFESRHSHTRMYKQTMNGTKTPIHNTRWTMNCNRFNIWVLSLYFFFLFVIL